MTKSRPELVTEIIDLIVEAVNLKHVPREKISETTQIAHGGLELDSIDILEIVVAIEQKYGLKIRNSEVGRTVFQSIGSVADYVQSSAQA